MFTKNKHLTTVWDYYIIPYITERINNMTWNVIMGIGLLMIVGGFLGFIFCEMQEREIDRKIAENQHFIDAILKTQEKK